MQFIVVRGGGMQVLRAPPERLPRDGYVWVDCTTEESRAWVEPVSTLTGVRVYEDHILDAENQGHPSYFESTSKYEMIIFRGLNVPPPGASAQHPIRVRTRPTTFFLLPAVIVTVRAPDSKLVAALIERMESAAENGQRLPASPEEILLRLLNHMIDRYLDMRQPLTDQVERWQRALLDPGRPFQDWVRLLEARSEARKLEQLCEEQLDAIQEWRDERIEKLGPTAFSDSAASGSELDPLAPDLQVRANDLVQHIQRVLTHARRLEQSVESAVQLHFSATAHRTNEIIRTLTTITAIFMPLTLITGIFGMNFEVIPGTHARDGFWIAVGVMLLIGVALLLFFRARRLISLREIERQLRPPARRAEPSDPWGS